MVLTLDLVLEHKCEGLEILYPTSMSGTQFLLGVEVFQSLVVRKDDELLWQQVLSLMSERLNHNIKFLIIGGVPHPSFIELVTEVGYGVSILTENVAYPYS